MLQLWKAVTFLARNPVVLAHCKTLAKVVLIPHADPQRRQQPDPDAIRALSSVLNGSHSLRLGLYELAEINRWLLIGGADTQLGSYATGIDLTASNSDGFNESVGALFLDPQVRQALAADPDPQQFLQQRGFQVTSDEANHLRARLATGSNSSNAASSFVLLAWGGGSCGSRLQMYSGYVHSNY